MGRRQRTAERPCGMPVPRLIALNKPFGVVCQFSRDGDRPTLADYIAVPAVYPAGRLDTDSEGLLLLTDHGPWQARIAEPRFKLDKTYLAQVEGVPNDTTIVTLANGITLNDGPTLPCRVRRVEEPDGLWQRDPPIRVRLAIPTTWLELTLREGRNRQVRRMTAAVGHPTLRLLRVAIGPWQLATLAPGEWCELDPSPLGPAVVRKGAVARADAAPAARKRDSRR